MCVPRVPQNSGDKLTHGEDIEESELSAEKAKLLVLKLLGME